MSQDGQVQYPETGSEAFAAYYQEHGYVVGRKLVDPGACDQLKTLFLEKVKPYKGPILRQTTTRPESHNFSVQGFMTNPILQIQDMREPLFTSFRAAALAIAADPAYVAAVAQLTNDDPILIQSMYYESGRGTEPHADTHFLDSQDYGRMVGTWVALEDIPEAAGRFFVYPDSHLLGSDHFGSQICDEFRAYEAMALGTINNYRDADKNFTRQFREVKRTQKAIAQLLERAGLTLRAPALQKGDVVFWGSRMFHGSLRPNDPSFTRNSMTAHFVPASRGLVRSHRKIEAYALETMGTLKIHHPAQAAV